MSGRLWVPPDAAAAATADKLKKHQAKVVRPFAQLQQEIRRMGFEAKLHHDPKERIVEIKFVPTTDKTKQAVKVAAGSSQANGLMVHAAYAVLDDWMQAALNCIEKGIEELKQL